MKTVNVHEAKANLSALLEEVRAGRSVAIAKRGVPYAHLVPVPIRGPRTPGLLKATVTGDLFEPLTEDELALWEA